MSKTAHIDAIIQEAFDAARKAAADFRAQHGEPFYCGFAWVNIKPGTSNLAKRLKALGYARKSYYGGVDVWNPSQDMTQSMDIKEAGAYAFATVLSKYGFRSCPMSRAD